MWRFPAHTSTSAEVQREALQDLCSVKGLHYLVSSELRESSDFCRGSLYAGTPYWQDRVCLSVFKAEGLVFAKIRGMFQSCRLVVGPAVVLKSFRVHS